ncbi:hypothetical protein A2U01_0072062, partial [Trifolium medium]|nr:hypothetical protein [Trifolium medium]
ESDEELSASGDKVTAGTEGASIAHVSKGKEPIVSVTAAVTPKRKRADKEKTENVMEGKKKVTKKKGLRRRELQRLLEK